WTRVSRAGHVRGCADILREEHRARPEPDRGVLRARARAVVQWTARRGRRDMEARARAEQVQSMGQAVRGSAEGGGGRRGPLSGGRWAMGDGRGVRRALTLISLAVFAAFSVAFSRPSPISHRPSRQDAPSRLDRGRFTAVFYPSEATLAASLLDYAVRTDT